MKVPVPALSKISAAEISVSSEHLFPLLIHSYG